MLQLGIIGAGNMGSAILRGIVADGHIKSNQIMVSDRNRNKMEELA